MKAEHRKELQTNVLADRLGRFLQEMKSGPKTSSWTLWACVGGAVVLFGGWKIYSDHKFSERSTLWVAVDRADSQFDPQMAVDLYAELAKAHPGTIPARTADFQIARTLLSQGLQNFASDREESIKRIVEARNLYEKLQRQAKRVPILQQEILMSLAKSEEALTGVPDPNGKEASLGTLDKALQYYEQLAVGYKDTFQGKAAAARIEVLKAQAKPGDLSATQFYAQLNELASSKPAPPPPPPSFEVKPGETKPGEAKPADHKSPDFKPIELQPSGSQIKPSTPAAEAKPGTAPPVINTTPDKGTPDPKAGEPKAPPAPAGTKAPDAKPAEGKTPAPVDKTPAPAEKKSADPKPAEAKSPGKTP